MVFSGENAPVVNWFFLVFFGAAVVAFVTPRPLPKMFRFRLKRKKKAAQEEQAQLVSNEPASSERERKDGGHWKATPRQDWTQEGWDVKLQIWWRILDAANLSILMTINMGFVLVRTNLFHADRGDSEQMQLFWTAFLPGSALVIFLAFFDVVIYMLFNVIVWVVFALMIAQKWVVHSQLVSHFFWLGLAAAITIAFSFRRSAFVRTFTISYTVAFNLTYCMAVLVDGWSTWLDYEHSYQLPLSIGIPIALLIVFWGWNVLMRPRIAKAWRAPPPDDV